MNIYTRWKNNSVKRENSNGHICILQPWCQHLYYHTEAKKNTDKKWSTSIKRLHQAETDWTDEESHDKKTTSCKQRCELPWICECSFGDNQQQCRWRGDQTNDDTLLELNRFLPERQQLHAELLNQVVLSGLFGENALSAFGLAEQDAQEREQNMKTGNRKMLETAFHTNTGEAETTQASRDVLKLIRAHNAGQKDSLRSGSQGTTQGRCHAPGVHSQRGTEVTPSRADLRGQNP